MHLPRFLFLFFLFPTIAWASSGDLSIILENVRFSTETFLEGRVLRIYASVTNSAESDLRGVVKFSASGTQIQGDQPVSVLAGKEDSVFVDFPMPAGTQLIRVVLVPFETENDNTANNSVEKEITVLADTDRDGIPNRDDTDDDNDGIADNQDVFPLNKNEFRDSDGDTIGDNKDDDDDNDGVKDADDGVPLNANESIDTDKDGIGNNSDTDDDGDSISDLDEAKKGTDPLKADTDGDGVNDRDDAFPLDPSQAHDFDKDGISDAKDKDADNDGIPKPQDKNDTNLGPIIRITSNEKSPRRMAYPGEIVTFETVTSTDPDGNIIATAWTSDGKEETGSLLRTSFQKSGWHRIAVKLTDDKGESREETVKILVIPPYIPWGAAAVILILLILAIFLIFSYSKRRSHEN